MKTFIVLFVIAVSMPAEAQRVKENVKQRVEIVEEQASPEVEEPKENSEEKPRGKRQKALEELKKQ